MVTDSGRLACWPFLSKGEVFFSGATSAEISSVPVDYRAFKPAIYSLDVLIPRLSTLGRSMRGCQKYISGLKPTLGGS
jgi:hypothetical protein